jgi:hypothetical protein
MVKETTIKIKEGEKRPCIPNSPTICIVDTGARTYLWIGNNGETDNTCFATLSGMKTLERLACGILTALGHDAKSIKKRIYENNKRK